VDRPRRRSGWRGGFVLSNPGACVDNRAVGLEYRELPTTRFLMGSGTHEPAGDTGWVAIGPGGATTAGIGCMDPLWRVTRKGPISP